MSTRQGGKPDRRLTIRDFAKWKRRGETFAMLTAYDFPLAHLLDSCSIPGILVGDSLGMVVQGHTTTIPVTLDEMIYHARMVVRGTKRALVTVDLPFPGCYTGEQDALAQSARILKESHAHAIKLEGGAEQADIIARLTTAGIPVMAHVGLRPQSVHQLGGYRMQRDGDQLISDAQAAASAGAFAIVLECIPSDVARTITNKIEIPTIGIGAGPHCDGQILVTHDLLGWTVGRVPQFVRPYAQLRNTAEQAVAQFARDVREGGFPSPKEVLG